MIDRHGDGIAAYCKPENTVALGFIEGLNNTIRVMQRRSYGLRDEEYLRVPAPQGPHLPARPDMKSGRNHPLGKEKTQNSFPRNR